MCPHKLTSIMDKLVLTSYWKYDSPWTPQDDSIYTFKIDPRPWEQTPSDKVLLANLRQINNRCAYTYENKDTLTTGTNTSSTSMDLDIMLVPKGATQEENYSFLSAQHIHNHQKLPREYVHHITTPHTFPRETSSKPNKQQMNTIPIEQHNLPREK